MCFWGVQMFAGTYWFKMLSSACFFQMFPGQSYIHIASRCYQMSLMHILFLSSVYVASRCFHLCYYQIASKCSLTSIQHMLIIWLYYIAIPMLPPYISDYSYAVYTYSLDRLMCMVLFLCMFPPNATQPFLYTCFFQMSPEKSSAFSLSIWDVCFLQMFYSICKTYGGNSHMPPYSDVMLPPDVL